VSRGPGVVLTFLGTFMLGVALMAQTYATDRLQRTPFDAERVTTLHGEATVNGTLVAVKGTSENSIDRGRSTDDVLTWTAFTCLVEDRPDVPTCVSGDDPSAALVYASIDDFATDRVTALAVNDPYRVPADAVPHAGLVNRFPFDAQKATYPWWDAVAGRALDARFVEVIRTAGLTSYHYRVVVEDEPIDMPGGVPATYSTTVDLFVDPTSGEVLDQRMALSQLDRDGTPVLQVGYRFDDDQVASRVEEARAISSRLRLVHVVIPAIGYGTGTALLLCGVTIGAVRRRRREIVVQRHPSEQLVSR
jgi:hypothetical protein